ncbi:cysteine desulfurase-like protein [Virgibacillus flavescens]|uniref:cysteine desulfurase-like protein n=1 Tax=Virgibacillus flavescens TaxID=1611422 RepID=UPI003D334816
MNNLIKTFIEARNYFPSLNKNYTGQKAFFFDNSAGAQVSHFVIDRVSDFYTNRNAQKGTIFSRTEQMQQTIIDGRQVAADLIGARDHTEIAFGLNATSLFQLFAHHLARDLHKGDHIIVTEADHRSNVDPWVELEERGIHVHLWNVDDDGNLDLKQYEKLLSVSPKIVAVGWASNATGTVHDMKKITKMAHAAGALVVADGVQTASHMPVDVKDAGVDFVAFSTYKIFGPHMGFCYINRDNLERLQDYRIKNELEENAYFFEVGTQNHEGIEAFIGSMEYLSKLASDAEENGLKMDPALLPTAQTEKRRELVTAMYWANEYEKELSRYFLQKLKNIPDVVLYGKGEDEIDQRVPVFSFNIKKLRAEDMGVALNDLAIEARTGDYFAINLMKRLAHDYNGSGLRISLVHYNTFEEIDYFFESLQRVLSEIDR